jgi:uncharacterized coiled-coil DUF342 family protein
MQLQSVELSNSLDELSAQALSIIPRVMRDAEKLRKEASAMKSKIAKFNESVAKVRFSSRDFTSSYFVFSSAPLSDRYLPATRSK